MPQLHPWNKHFQWTDHDGPLATITRAQAREFDVDGFFAVDDLIPAAEIAEITAELDRFEARADQFLQSQEGGRFAIAETGAITFAPNLTARSELAKFCHHPRLLELCADLIGPDVNLYWDQAVYKKPEKPRRFPWHQDNGYTFIEPQQYLTCWIALTDATVENGCPQVAPGYHRYGTLAHHYVEPLGWECFNETPPTALPAPVRAGGAVVFSSLTPHLTGPNMTTAVRKAYIVQYAPAGAEVLRGDPNAGAPTERSACDDPGYQFSVLRDGAPT